MSVEQPHAGGADVKAALLAQLQQACAKRQTLTYRQMIERLGLESPAMRRLTAALEQLAAEDARAGRPIRAALVVSQGGSGIPRRGFFECLERLGQYSGAHEGAPAQAWHAAELARVFALDRAGSQ